MKKKVLGMILISTMVCSITACGSASTPTSTAEDTDVAVDDTETTATAAEDPETTADTETSDDFGVTLGNFEKDANIEETVLYDDNDVVITATGLTYTNYDVELNLTFENNSDKNLEFIAESMGYSVNAVNEYMIEDGYLSLDVAAGESGEDTIGFDYDELIIHGMTEVAELQVGFDISDEEYNDIYTGPLSIKTDLADSYDYNSDGYRAAIQSQSLKYTYDVDLAYFSEEEVYNSNGISIVSEAYMVNTDGERRLMLEVKNDSEDDIYFVTSNLKANDTVIYDSTWSGDCITAGKKMIVHIALDNVLDEEEWKEMGITDIETIGFTVEVKNDGGYDVAEPSDVTIALK